MSPSTNLAMVAVDLGAESCRVSLLFNDGDGMRIELVHRFSNAAVQTDSGLTWDFERISQQVVHGLKQCAARHPEGIHSIGVDGWAVDYLRYDLSGTVLGRPFCYRDERTIGAIKAVHQQISPERLYAMTGTRTFRFNTLYQLFADGLRGIPASYPWLNLPEALLHSLGGCAVSEFTNATHTQMLGLDAREWEPEIFKAAGLSLGAAPPVVMPGADLGRMSGPLAELPAFGSTRLIAPACHDTASAVAGIPAEGSDWAFLSSGTWSLLGAVLDRPHTGREAMERNFTNHGGVGGSIYFLKNINGMWLLRQSMEHWEHQGRTWAIDELMHATESLPEPVHLIDVDAPELLLPGDIPGRIDAQLAHRGFPPAGRSVADAPQYANLIFHSLAARYAEVLRELESITGKRFKRLYVVGGGSRNTRLNQLIERASGLSITLGSAESSTLGNFAVQLAAAELPTGSNPVAAAAVARWATALA